MTRALKVLKRRAETVRQRLLLLDASDRSKKPITTETHVFFALTKAVPKTLGTATQKKFTAQPQRPTLAKLLRGVLTAKEQMLLKKSFDRLGDLLLLEIPVELAPKQKKIGEAFLKLHPSTRAVFKKASAITGSHRTRSLIRLAGTGGTQTAVQENGCTFQVDLAKVFYTSRLSTERKRVAAQVKPNEIVADLFAGVGPFAILIAKTQPTATVYAIDINQYAIDSLRKNVQTNHVTGRVIAARGPAEKVAPLLYTRMADRVILNLPKTENNYLPLALQLLKKRGGIIHQYTFATNKAMVRAVIKTAMPPKTEYTIKTIRRVRSYSPSEDNYVADIRVR